MIKVIKQWTSKVILIALMLIAIEVPPMAVNFALRYCGRIYGLIHRFNVSDYLVGTPDI